MPVIRIPQIEEIKVKDLKLSIAFQNYHYDLLANQPDQIPNDNWVKYADTSKIYQAYDFLQPILKLPKQRAFYHDVNSHGSKTEYLSGLILANKLGNDRFSKDDLKTFAHDDQQQAYAGYLFGGIEVENTVSNLKYLPAANFRYCLITGYEKAQGEDLKAEQLLFILKALETDNEEVLDQLRLKLEIPGFDQELLLPQSIKAVLPLKDRNGLLVISTQDDLAKTLMKHFRLKDPAIEAYDLSLDRNGILFSQGG